MRKAIRYLFSSAVALAILAPMFRRPPVDGFPLSTYPMFSERLRTPRTTVHHAIAVLPDSRREVIPPKLATGNEAALQAEAVIDGAIRRGTATGLCRRIAARVSGTRFARAVALEIATSTFDSLAFFSGDRAPRQRVVHARCWPAAR